MLRPVVFAATIAPRICVQFERPAPDAVLEWRFDELERAGLVALDWLSTPCDSRSIWGSTSAL